MKSIAYIDAVAEFDSQSYVGMSDTSITLRPCVFYSGLLAGCQSAWVYFPDLGGESTLRISRIDHTLHSITLIGKQEEIIKVLNLISHNPEWEKRSHTPMYFKKPITIVDATDD